MSFPRHIDEIGFLDVPTGLISNLASTLKIYDNNMFDFEVFYIDLKKNSIIQEAFCSREYREIKHKLEYGNNAISLLFEKSPNLIKIKSNYVKKIFDNLSHFFSDYTCDGFGIFSVTKITNQIPKKKVLKKELDDALLINNKHKQKSNVTYVNTIISKKPNSEFHSNTTESQGNLVEEETELFLSRLGLTCELNVELSKNKTRYKLSIENNDTLEELEEKLLLPLVGVIRKFEGQTVVYLWSGYETVSKNIDLKLLDIQLKKILKNTLRYNQNTKQIIKRCWSLTKNKKSKPIIFVTKSLYKPIKTNRIYIFYCINFDLDINRTKQKNQPHSKNLDYIKNDPEWEWYYKFRNIEKFSLE